MDLVNKEMNIEEKSFEWIVEPLLDWYAVQARKLPWRENREPYWQYIQLLTFILWMIYLNYV